MQLTACNFPFLKRGQRCDQRVFGDRKSERDSRSIERFQERYYDTISLCNRVGNSDAFIEFMLEMIDQALDDVILQVNKASIETSEYVKKMLILMEYDVPYTSNDIMIERLKRIHYYHIS